MASWKVRYTFVTAGEDCSFSEEQTRWVELLFQGVAVQDGEVFGRWYKRRYGEVMDEQFRPAFERAARCYRYCTECPEARMAAYEAGALKGYKQERYDPFATPKEKEGVQNA